VITLGLSTVDATKATGASLITRIPAAVSSRLDGWFGVIRESFAGAWQRNIELNVETSLSHCTAWTCVTLIVSDIAKLRPMLMQEVDGIASEVDNPAYSPVLRKPNHFQNRIQFITCWMISKLTRGNAYVLKRRDSRGVVNALYVLDPTRVQVLVAANGEVYYELTLDPLSTLSTDSTVTVPASEIIHDILIPLYHPLVGVSAFYALGAVVTQGLQIIANSSKVFANGSQPAGVLTAPNAISEAAAERIQKHWDANFAGVDNVGKVAVLGDGLKFEKMSMTAVDLQLIDQLKWGDEKVCGALHVPAYMAGVGTSPTYQNAETMNQQYYSQCLQSLIEAFELCLSEGLGLANDMYVELDVENGLLRMDSATKMKNVTDGIKGGVFTPNEGRRMFSRRPITGGDTVYLQEQDHSLDWLSRRDALPIEAPPAPPAPAPALPPAPDDQAKSIKAELTRRTTKAALAARVLERMKRAA
jgi:HK97 family phage portal protein